MQMKPAATILSQSALNSAQVFGSSLMPALSRTALLAHSQLMRWMFIGAATQSPFGFITGRSSGATTLSQPSSLGELVHVGGHAGLVPLGDLGTLELHGRRRVAGNHVGAELGQRVGGMAGDRGLLPVAAGGREHLAELGDGRGVGAARPTDAACWSWAWPRRRRARATERPPKRRHISGSSSFPPTEKPRFLPSADRF